MSTLRNHFHFPTNHSSLHAHNHAALATPQPSSTPISDFALFDDDDALTSDVLAILAQQPGYTQHQPTASFSTIIPTPPSLQDRVHASTSAGLPPRPAAAATSPDRSSVAAPNGQMFATTLNNMGGAILPQSKGLKRTRSHQRTPSTSTVASNGPASPFVQNAPYTYIANGDTSPNSPAHFAEQTTFQKNLPTPSQTPTEPGFLQADISPQFAPMSNAHLAMKDFAIQHHVESDYPSDLAPSRQSMSSHGNDSPATPQSGLGDMDLRAYNMLQQGEANPDGFSNMIDCLPFDELDVRQTNPNIQLYRTDSQAYQDELYNPQPPFCTSMPASMSKPQHPNAFLSPHRNLINQRLETANLYRSQSPASAVSRERSPFRDGSPLAPSKDWRATMSTAGSVSHIRRQQKEEAEQAEYAQHRPALKRESTKTISPKDAVLDYHETADQPSLFPDKYPVGYDTHRGGTEHWPSNYQAFGGLAPTNQQSMAFRDATSAESGYTGSGFSFPQLPHGNPDQIQSSPFQANYQANTAEMHHFNRTPDFPAPLPSMETSTSDVGIGLSSQEEITSIPQRPDDTRANTGAYTCTYHGCAQRFDSQPNLQKHKREHHRSQQPNSSTSVSGGSLSPRDTESPAPSGSGMTSAAILARNSQAGPHKCERINPSTGKPCNTIFSRPYDLTRHEDTIHNNRKQKVRCQYCREEKTFSRTDALTRHMRVVHPEIESFGKRGRRGD